MTQAKQIQMTPPAPAYTVEDIIKVVKDHLVETPVDVKGLAKHFDVCQDTIYRWVSAGHIPAKLCHPIAGRNYFFLSEITEYLKGQ